MTREQKREVVEMLKKRLDQTDFFYIADASTMTVEEVNTFRRRCFEKNVEMRVVKNTLLRKALETYEDKNYEELYETLSGPTAVLFTDTANVPAKVIKAFRDDHDRPILKAAYIETAVYIGDDKVKALSELKSKEDLLGDVILLLQSPIKNVMSSLNSGGQTISGLLKALEERGDA